MEELPYYLFAAGVLFFVIYIAMTVNVIVKNKKGVNTGIVIMFLLGTVLTGASLVTYFKSPILKSITQKISGPDNASNQSAEKNTGSSNANPKAVKFDPNGSVRPKVVNPPGNSTSPGLIYIDADGTKSFVDGDTTLVAVFPNGIRSYIDDVSSIACVELPLSGYKDGKFHYTRYSFSVGDMDGEATVVKEVNAIYINNTDPIGGGNGNGQIQMFSADDPVSQMSNVDFIYQRIPLQKPKKTVNNPLMVGNWEYKTTDLANQQHTPLKMEITKDGYITVTTDLINSFPGFAKYKLEPLGKNA